MRFLVSVEGSSGTWAMDAYVCIYIYICTYRYIFFFCAPSGDFKLNFCTRYISRAEP